MRCPNCQSTESTVVDTRDYPTYRRRRRGCSKCSSRYSTYEVGGEVFSAIQVTGDALSKLISTASGPLVDLADIVKARGPYDK